VHTNSFVLVYIALCVVYCKVRSQRARIRGRNKNECTHTAEARHMNPWSKQNRRESNLQLFSREERCKMPPPQAASCMTAWLAAAPLFSDRCAEVGATRRDSGAESTSRADCLKEQPYQDNTCGHLSTPLVARRANRLTLSWTVVPESQRLKLSR